MNIEMRAADATLLSTKMKKMKKLLASINTPEDDPSAKTLKNNCITIIMGLIKDVEIIFEKDKKYFALKTKNKGNYKTGYPCKPIKPRKRRATNATNSSISNGNTN